MTLAPGGGQCDNDVNVRDESLHLLCADAVDLRRLLLLRCDHRHLPQTFPQGISTVSYTVLCQARSQGGGWAFPYQPEPESALQWRRQDLVRGWHRSRRRGTAAFPENFLNFYIKTVVLVHSG